MSNLIDRQAAIDEMNSLEKFSLIDSNGYLHGVGVRLKFVEQKLEQLPSAEPEIIRCKDCKWFDDIGCAIGIVDDTDKPSENDYCSFAEPEHEYTMEEFMLGQDMGNPEDGSL